jgi:hypothetical protein
MCQLVKGNTSIKKKNWSDIYKKKKLLEGDKENNREGEAILEQCSATGRQQWLGPVQPTGGGPDTAGKCEIENN